MKINYTDLSSIESIHNKTIEENNLTNITDENDLSTNVEFYKKYKEIEAKLESMKLKMAKNNVLKARDIETVIQSRRITLIELLKYKYINRKTILKHLNDNKTSLKENQLDDKTIKNCFSKTENNFKNNSSLSVRFELKDNNITNKNKIFNRNSDNNNFKGFGSTHVNKQESVKKGKILNRKLRNAIYRFEELDGGRKI